jgi:hypothetical protein
MRGGNCEWKKDREPFQNRLLISLSERYFALKDLMIIPYKVN